MYLQNQKREKIMFNKLSSDHQAEFDYWASWNVDMEYCMANNIDQEDLRNNDDLVEAFLAEIK